MAIYAFSQSSCVRQIQDPAGRALLGAASTFLVILYICVALLSRWIFSVNHRISSVRGLTSIGISQSRLESSNSEKKSLQGTMQTVLD